MQTIIKSEFIVKLMLLAGIGIFQLSAIASPLSPHFPSSSFIITGDINDSKSASVELKYYTYYFSANSKTPKVELTTEIRNGKFKFVVTSAQQYGYVTIHVPGNREPAIVNLFLISQGDSINIDLTGKIKEFSGRGSEKFTCQYQLANLPFTRFNTEKLKQYKGKLNYDVAVLLHEMDDSLYSLKMQKLKTFENILKPEIIEILYLDNTGQYLFDLYSTVRIYISFNKDSEAIQGIYNYYYEFLDGKYNINLTSPLLVHSRSYADYLIEKIKVDLMVRNYKAVNSNTKFTLEEMYQAINKSYKGSVQQKLITISFVQLFSTVDTNVSLLKEAIIKVKHPYLNDMLTKISEANVPGRPAYNFNLPDTSGNIISLSEIKAKVLVVSLWLAGCTYCLHMAKQMQLVREACKGMDVQFISICVTAESNEWKEAVKSGKYAALGDICLSTGTAGTKHPMITHYGYRGYPQILLIDSNKRIITTKPVRPSNEKTTGGFVKLIRDSMNY